jgi:outer membrane receptor protein involved in Fe transport
MKTGVQSAVAIACLCCCSVVRAAEVNPASVLEAPTVEVVGTTPLPGIGIPVDQVPASVQSATGASIRQQNTIDLSQFLDRNVGSVSITDGQVNPFMPDLNFRGFTGSPLLGVPQGISAFFDGVRINEAFGDTINWDLIPQSAISTINLIPGSNPVFGLNTLGGALSINTKSGKEYPGGSVWTQWGSWGRNNVGAEFGAKKGPVDFYITGNYLDENGWRDHSPSRLNQWFAKIGYETSDFDADLSYSYADNQLQGTQATPLSLLDFAHQQAYTYPDITQNRLNFVNLRLSKVLTPEQVLGGNIYYRGLKSSNLSSNVNDAFGGGPCPVDCPATLDQSTIDQAGSGATIQYTLLTPLAGHDNKFTVGTSYDHGDTRFTQLSQVADFTNDRNTVGADPFTPETDVETVNRYYGVYATDTFSLNQITHVTVSGRYNRARVNITDKSGADPLLAGDHTFVRFNPAIGLNYNPNKALNTYVTYNQGMRTPTPVELTCADPNAACKLPNAFLADPALKPVVSKTWELGTRGMLTANTYYSASIFRTDLRDDIQFVSASSSGTTGFFQNVGKTRRQGLELNLQQRFGKLQLKAAYSYIDARFQSAFTVNSPNNSSKDANGDIQVSSGNRIPGIPTHNFKLRAEYAFIPAVIGGLNLVYAGSQFARGDENNQDINGKVPSYMVVNLDARWNMTDQLQFFGTITNLFDRKYETFGVLGENFFRGPGFTYDQAAAGPEQFRSPGAPRGIWVGVRYAFGGAKVSDKAAHDND